MEELKKEFEEKFVSLTGNKCPYVMYRFRDVWQWITSNFTPKTEWVSVEEKEYEPYFGWCDVDGCENESCSGGVHWKETGYWRICMTHADEHRAGKAQPKMKQSAIDRENSRDKITSILPPPPHNLVSSTKVK